ncbi:unnamed protein product [Darwinula stevensoni]|uniref:Ig-like domain-containing protein n=1 Tax=Darwinula stevensoni TaxID=69355 RepID=A0A7R9A9H8_9CRUS|nr:unnamed protein product [Darwinula stevensoni]CAG0897413.1 unnamed protein product [Darwinula stevensoni]
MPPFFPGRGGTSEKRIGEFRRDIGQNQFPREEIEMTDFGVGAKMSVLPDKTSSIIVAPKGYNLSLPCSPFISNGSNIKWQTVDNAKKAECKGSNGYVYMFPAPDESEIVKAKPVIYVEMADSLEETSSETVIHVEEHSVIHVHCLTLGSDVRWRWSDSSHPENTGENVQLKVQGTGIPVIYSKLTVNVSRNRHGQNFPEFLISREPEFGHPLFEGMKVSLNCEVDANPVSTPLWIKSSHSREEVRGENGLLYFDAVVPDDSGWYKCMTSHALGNFSSLGYLLNIMPVDVEKENEHIGEESTEKSKEAIQLPGDFIVEEPPLQVQTCPPIKVGKSRMSILRNDGVLEAGACFFMQRHTFSFQPETAQGTNVILLLRTSDGNVHAENMDFGVGHKFSLSSAPPCVQLYFTFHILVLLLQLLLYEADDPM